MAAILEGIRILDMTRVLAGPWCTQNLADLGADVIKIEKPGDGDDARRMVPFLRDAAGNPTNDSALYLACNRGKRSITLDYASAEGAAIVRSLVAHCDVLVENYKPGSLARHGLDYESLRALRPDLIYCSVTGFGPDGPYAGRPAYDFIMQGMAGLMSTCGQPDGSPGGEPMRTAIPITDIFTALYATIAIQGALHHRLRTGEGQHLDIAMLDVAVAINANLATGYLMSGQVPTRVGNTNPLAAPSGVFHCADGQLIIAAGNDSQFVALCRALGTDWHEDPRFQRNGERVRHRDTLHARLAAEALRRTRAEWLALLEKAGVPGGPINDMADVFADPQVQHRDLAMTLPHATGQAVPTLRSPLRYSHTPVRYSPPPTLGQHTDDILRSLGHDDAAIAALRAAGTI